MDLIQTENAVDAGIILIDCTCTDHSSANLVTMIQNKRRFWATSVSVASLLSAMIFSESLLPRPAQGAEEIRLVVGGPLVLSASVDSLETFAETGELPDDLKLYARFLDPDTLEMVRAGLNRTVPLGMNTVAYITYSPLGENVLFNIGKIIRVHPEVNGFNGLRAATILAAANHPEGWTLVDVLKAFPTDTINLKLEDLMALRQGLAVYLSYNQAVVEAIQVQARDEAATQPVTDLATLADLDQPGPYGVEKETLVVRNPALRQTDAGLTVNYDFPVDVYLPQGTRSPAPVVIISHGFGDVKESFTFIARHLASYGFVAILPEHVGSDLNYRQQFLNGQLDTLLSPMEFLNRPREITFLIDELERLVNTSPRWAERLNLDQIGIMGDSLGGSTALSLAGAEINYARLSEACGPDSFSINFALYLECRARFLPPQNYQLKDQRIKAVYVTHPVGGYLFGPEGMGQIDIPLLMVVGSNDIVATAVTEQVHPFVWLQTQPKYLALLQVGTHFSSKPGRETNQQQTSAAQNSANQVIQLLTGQHRDVGTRYSEALSVAFWKTYLQDQTAYRPYLTASYGLAVSAGQPMRLDIIQSLTPAQLEAAYGHTPPVSIIPPPMQAVPPPRDESILAEIKRTGVLKVAFRQDAAPFGYINSANQWDGYCGDIAIALTDYLSQKLDTPIGVELVELTSTLQTRFDLVRQGSVHLECGPNTIRQDIPGITFSTPLYITGARFLVPRSRSSTNFDLPGVTIGVLQDTTTEAFIHQRYPRANIVTFSGVEDRKQAVQAVVLGEIDAFAGDSVLSEAEMQRQHLSPSQVALVPEIPLTCEYYGLILPNDDPAWKAMVNQFLVETEDVQATLEQDIRELEYCLNQA